MKSCACAAFAACSISSSVASLVAPKQVLPYRAAEQHVLLKHHCDGISEFVELVVLDVDAPDLHLAVQNVVKSGNQLDESGLCRARAAYDTDGFTAPDMQVDVFKIEDVAGFRIGKIDVVEIDTAVFDFDVL